MPYVVGKRKSKSSREVAVLRDDKSPLNWTGFVEGCHRLWTQINEDSWKPDLVVAVNRGGAAVAGVIGYTPQVAGTSFGVAIAEDDRKKDVVLSLPPIADPKNCEVLLVDIQMRSGESLEIVEQALKKKKFISERMRAAVLVLANLRDVPSSGKPVKLTLKDFPCGYNGPRPAYESWLKRLHYLGFVCKHIPKHPWEPWKEVKKRR